MTLAVMLTLLLAQASPSPTASACPTVLAQLVEPVQPNLPADIAQSDAPPFEIDILVTVGPDGSVVATKPWRPSLYLSAVAAAMAAARESTYKPKMVNCKPVTGDYLFRADFTP
jgi:hypothetical protein